MFRQSLKYTAGIITISEKNKKLLCDKYGLAKLDVNMIRLSIDLDFWQRSPRDINILTVARFTPRKGWHELIEAAKILGHNFHFYGVGFGELDIETLAYEAGVGEQFTIFQKLRPKHLRLLMQACDIFCLPSKPTSEEGSEGIPVVLMEAMAMGMPIVTTDDGSICELVKKEIVPTCDAPALAEALRNISENKIVTEHLKQRGSRERVTKMHGPNNLEQLDSFFRQVVKRT